MRTPTSMIQVAMPLISRDTKNFKFSTVVSGVSLTFNFAWSGTVWRGWADMPDLSKRPFGINPNATNWTGFPDYGLLFVTPLSLIGLNDWTKVSMYVLVW